MIGVPVFRVLLAIAVLGAGGSAALAQPAGLQFRLVLDEAAVERGEAEWLEISEDEGSLPVALQSVLSGATLECVAVAKDKAMGWWALNLTFDEAGGRELAELTRTHQWQQLALVLNGRLMIAPLLNSPIEGRYVTIGRDGSSREQVEADAEAIRAARPGTGTCVSED